MPTPTATETKKDFIDRCIPYVINEGTANSPEQAYAICQGLWNENKFNHIIKIRHINGYNKE